MFLNINSEVLNLNSAKNNTIFKSLTFVALCDKFNLFIFNHFISCYCNV